MSAHPVLKVLRRGLSGELGNRVRARGGASREEYAALLAGHESAWVTADGQLLVVDVAEHEANITSRAP